VKSDVLKKPKSANDVKTNEVELFIIVEESFNMETRMMYGSLTLEYLNT